MTNVPTPQQQQIFDKHNGDDKKRLHAFINEHWPCQQNDSRAVDANICCLSVSTTLRSTVFLLSIGWGSKFAYNPFSEEPKNPWLISCVVQNNPDLARFIREQWDESLQAMPGNAGQNRINDIAPHVLYDATNAQVPPQLVKLTVDGNNVRANVRDIEVWSHPPRDEPLRAVVGERGYSQRLGHVKASARQWKGMRTTTFPDESIRKQRLEQKRQEFQHRFNELWTTLQLELPNSFQWPTIQLKQGQQRFGDMAAGVHGERADEAHNKFPAIGVSPRNTKRDVFNALVKSEIEGVDFNSLMPEG